jgi:formylglycine-generating enzyme
MRGMGAWRAAQAALLASVVVAACGGSSSEEANAPEKVCVSGSTQACVGVAACNGGQICLADGSGYGTCECGNTPDGGGGGSAGDIGVGGSDAAAGNGGTPTGGTSSGGVGGIPIDAGVGGASGTAGVPSSGGSGGGLPSKCANLPGPVMVDMGGWCIDSTEISALQYQEFLAAKAGDTSGQSAMCANNTSFAPHSDGFNCAKGPTPYLDPVNYPNLPVRCVDWCDAAAYCAWAGKRLCGKVSGGSLTLPDLSDASTNQWLHTCTQGGTSTYPYGNLHVAGACWPQAEISVSSHDVATAPNCHGAGAPFSSVHDLVGNADEWLDYCDPLAGPTPKCAHAGENACADYQLFNFNLGTATTGVRCCSN